MAIIATREELVSEINRKGGVYLASGWFNPEQLERCEYVRDTLKYLGFHVFSPKDENLVSTDSTADSKKQAFVGNLKAIKDSAFMLCITNQKDLGTIFESGYAYAVGTPIVYFAEGLNGPFNLMLAQSGVHVLTSRDQLSHDLQDVEILYRILTGDRVEFSGDIE